MAKIKYDGVVVAVRYTPEGSIDWVRAFERRTSAFSDRLMIPRERLVADIQSGKKFMTGKRIHLLGTTFEVKDTIQVVEKNGKELVVSGNVSPDKDFLEGVPIL